MAKAKKAKKSAEVAKPKKDTPPAAVPVVPDQGTAPVAVEVEFERPDPKKGILNVADRSPVSLIVLKGREFPTDGNGTLIFLQNGRSTDLLTPADAARKFHQDAEGQVYYSVSGFVANPLHKAVDVLELVD